MTIPLAAITCDPGRVDVPANLIDPVKTIFALASENTASIGGLDFAINPLDCSLRDNLTVSFDVTDGTNTVATYKLNILEHASRQYLVFCPLVIMWADHAAHRKSGMDAAIIAHCTAWAGRLAIKLGPAMKEILIVTGYLTTQRAGTAFFTRLGWRIFRTPAGKSANKSNFIHKLAAYIDAISLPMRTQDDEKIYTRFAYRRFKCTTPSRQLTLT